MHESSVRVLLTATTLSTVRSVRKMIRSSFQMPKRTIRVILRMQRRNGQGITGLAHESVIRVCDFVVALRIKREPNEHRVVVYSAIVRVVADCGLLL